MENLLRGQVSFIFMMKIMNV